jgi:hypothetical protein
LAGFIVLVLFIAIVAWRRFLRPRDL